jgi:hypothetical protein
MNSGGDFELLVQIRDVCDRLDPVPPEVLEAARGALRWLTPDAALAELTADSLAGLAAVRSLSRPRLVSYESAALTVHVQITGTGGSRRLVGQLVPPRAAHVTVRSPHADHRAEHTVQADESGRFTADGVPPGPVSLLCRLVDSPDRPVATSWVAI